MAEHHEPEAAAHEVARPAEAHLAESADALPEQQQRVARVLGVVVGLTAPFMLGAIAGFLLEWAGHGVTTSLAGGGIISLVVAGAFAAMLAGVAAYWTRMRRLNAATELKATAAAMRARLLAIQALACMIFAIVGSVAIGLVIWR